MSTRWLRDELARTSNAATDGGDPILTIYLDGGRKERIYCPNPDEYRVTADVVDKAMNLGATIIAYSETWCGATVEGDQYGARNGVEVMPYRNLFRMLRTRGVGFVR